MESKRSAAIAQVVTGALGASVALVIVGTDAWNNWHYYAPINTTLAIVAVASAFGLIALPWKGMAGIAKAMCLGLVIVAGATVYANDLGMNISAAAEAGEKHASAAADAKAARATLARITEVREVKALETLVADAERTLQGQEAKARGYFGKNDTAACSKRRACRRAAAMKAALLDALAQARARDAAKAELTKAKAKANDAGPVNVDVLSAAIAPRLGMDVHEFARRWALGLVILLVGTAQILALYGHTALTQIGEGWAVLSETSAAKAKKTAAKARATAAPKVNAKSKGGRKAAKTRDEALEILRAMARRTDGRIVASIATLAKMLEVSPSTVGDKKKGWLAYWAKTGAVEIEERGVFRVIERKAA